MAEKHQIEDIETNDTEDHSLSEKQLSGKQKDKEHLNKVRHRSIELFSEKLILKNALKQINIQKDEIERKNSDLQQKNEEILTQQEHLIKANYEIIENNKKLNNALDKARRRTKVLFGKHIDLKKAKNYISIVNEDVEQKNAKLKKTILKARKRTIDLFGKHIDLKKAKKRNEFQGKLLQESYNELEIKNIQINDSLEYAKHIQRAILPPNNDIKKHFPNSFVFFKPKDVVSGDFYWLAEKNNNIYFAIIDCTGHGVPGAFMSMIGNTILNQIVNEFSNISPAKMLKKLDDAILSAFYREKEDSDFQNDGMDISICKYDKLNKKVYLSSAGQNYCIVKDNKAEIFKGAVFGISEILNYEYVNKIEEISFSIENPVMVYMYTDGFLDQFGGNKSKKYNHKRFLELIKNNYTVPMQNQKEIFEDAFIDWKGEETQIDDVLVMGIKFS